MSLSNVINLIVKVKTITYNLYSNPPKTTHLKKNFENPVNLHSI